MTEPMDKLYDFKIVGFDRVSELTRDVTVISVEVPNEWLERVMTRDQLDETHRRYGHTSRLTPSNDVVVHLGPDQLPYSS